VFSLSRAQKVVALGSWLGWSLDGYDLVLMLLVIPSISQLFFPSSDTTLSLMAIFATYVITLIMRPFGGAFFGNLGDKYGRKKPMVITILGFSLATFATGFLPTWQMAGIFAPILLIILRFIQGFFAGGEWGSGTVITMETVNKPLRGLLSGFLQSGYNLGFVIASIVYQLVISQYPGNSFLEMGWRIMFFTGIIPGLVATFVRFKMSESATWLQKSRDHKIERSPLKKIFVTEKRKFFLALIIMTGLMFSYYTTIGFLPTFLQKYVNLDKPEVAALMIVATVTSLLGQIFTGFVSQYIGRRKTMMLVAIAAITIAIPSIYGLYHASAFFERVVYVIVLIMAATTGFGPIPAFLAERFQTSIRNSASGFAYNGGLLVGSWAPLVAVTILSHVGKMAPVFLGINLMIGSIILLIGAKLNPETKDVDLSD
jgi:MHS family proline/betaine transporter-like MFS transporter